MEYSKEQIRRQFDSLPKSLRQFIAEADLEKITNELQKKYSLHLDQLGALAEEIHLVMIGLTPARDFQRRIKNKIGLSEDTVNLITYDLNQEIFSQIRRELEKIAIPEDSQEFYQAKMSGISSVPKEEVAVEDKTEDNKDTATPTKPIRDPYREPIE